KVPSVIVSDGAHAGEQSLEVELPFLQRILPDDFVMVPLAVGEARAAEVRQALDALWGGDETVIVVSSDLSHYLDYDVARSVDARTADKITSREASALELHEACGAIAVNALLLP